MRGRLAIVTLAVAYVFPTIKYSSVSQSTTRFGMNGYFGSLECAFSSNLQLLKSGA